MTSILNSSIKVEEEEYRVVALGVIFRKPLTEEHVKSLMRGANEIEENIIVFVDPDYLCADLQIIAACYHAIKSFKYGTNLARKIPLEILLYIVCTKEIKKAIKAGIKPGMSKVDVIILCKEGKIEENPVKVLKTLLNNCGISEGEYEISPPIYSDCTSVLKRISGQDLPTKGEEENQQEILKSILTYMAYVNILKIK